MYTNLIRLALAALIAIPTTAAAAGSIRLPATGQTACFNSSGVVIACTGTGQDGETRAGVAWPAPRFTDNTNGTLTDNLTGLIWSKHANAPELALGAGFCPGTPGPEKDMSWQQALDYIKCLNVAGYLASSDWRLPNLNELESMVNAGAADTSAYLTDSGFGLLGLDTLVQPSQYWSSTNDASDLVSALDVDMMSGEFPFSSVKIPVIAGLDTRGVWPVRGISNGPATLPATGQSACFDAAGVSTACTGSGQDGDKPAGAAWPAPRFKSNAAGTLALDRLTGLVWTTSSKTPGPANPAPAGCAASGSPLSSWQTALDHTNCLKQNTFLGLSDWRLPNRKELRSLVDYSRSAPALSAGHPFSDLLQGDTYWTSTSDASQSGRAWTVNMFDGSLGASGKINGGVLPAWPVSGPDLVAPTLAITQGNMTTNVASQTIDGTVEAGANVTVAINGGTPASASVTGSTWSFTSGPLPAGMNAITVSAADFSENKSTASISITIDSAAPALTINPVTATNKKNLTIGGTMETGATVAVKMGTTTIPVTVNGTAWSAPVNGLAAGVNNISITATDVAGNVATQAATITFTAPDGLISGGSAINIGDALKALRIAVGIVPPSFDDLLRGDVAPIGAPDDRIDAGDALLILKKSVGLPSF